MTARSVSSGSSVSMKKIPAFAARNKSGVDAGLFDPWLLASVVLLLALGLVMVSSASLHISEKAFAQPWHYTLRQAAYIGLGLMAAAFVLRTRLVVWERMGPILLMAGLVMLVLVLIPGIGREVNGSSRWINMGLFNLQVSELMKLFVIVYLAGYTLQNSISYP